MAASMFNILLRNSLTNFGQNTTLQAPSVGHLAVCSAWFSTSSCLQSRARPKGLKIKLKYTNSKTKEQLTKRQWIDHLNKVRKPRVEEEDKFVIPKLEDSPDDMPIEMEDPFKPERQRCFLCKHNIELDYKNVRLLSQFVSPYTGRTYNRHITGLCGMQQKRISKEIRRAHVMGLMPFMYKLPQYMKDPVLFGVSPTRVGLLAELQKAQYVDDDPEVSEMEGQLPEVVGGQMPRGKEVGSSEGGKPTNDKTS